MEVLPRHTAHRFALARLASGNVCTESDQKGEFFGDCSSYTLTGSSGRVRWVMSRSAFSDRASRPTATMRDWMLATTCLHKRQRRFAYRVEIRFYQLIALSDSLLR